MRRTGWIGLLSVMIGALAPGVPAWAQQGPAGEVEGNRGIGQTTSSLGSSPGEPGIRQELNSPSDQPFLGGGVGTTTPRVPSSVLRPGQEDGPQRVEGAGIGTPTVQPLTDVPIYGTLAIPGGGEDEGPPEGISLDLAIDRLVRENLDLRSKFLEIPQAQADVLTAGLRANPILFADAQLIPYGRYSDQRPGGQTQYDVNISHPFDLSGKRRARTIVACRAKRVIEAQYQDYVRLQIDNLYRSFVDVLAARETVRFARTSLDGLEEYYRVTEDLLRKGGMRTRAELNRIKIQRDSAAIGLVDAEELFRRARRNLGVLLNVPPDQAEVLEVRGRLRDSSPPPPPSDALIQLALQYRPDLNAFRLGVRRAEADVRLQLANRFADVYVLYQPYTFQDNEPLGLKSAHSWALGVTVPLPVYNRNQGNIARAKLNVTQTQIELANQERTVVTEVKNAEREYALTRSAVERIEAELLPDATQVLTDTERLFRSGEVDVVALLIARQNYNEIAKQYRDTAVRHRRSMLFLNTTLGQRVLP